MGKLKLKSRFIPSRVVCPCCTLERPATVILYFFSFVLAFVFPALSGITRVSCVCTPSRSPYCAVLLWVYIAEKN